MTEVCDLEDYQHYVRTDSKGIAVHGFTSGFERPKEGDILLPYETGRHFRLQLRNEREQYRYKVIDGELVERPQQELDVERAAQPPALPSAEERMQAMEDTLSALMGL